MHESVAKTTCFVKSIELLISFKVLTIHCTLQKVCLVKTNFSHLPTREFKHANQESILGKICYKSLIHNSSLFNRVQQKSLKTGVCVKIHFLCKKLSLLIPMNNKNKYISIKVFIDVFFSFSLKMKLYINAYELENWEGNEYHLKYAVVITASCAQTSLNKNKNNGHA